MSRRPTRLSRRSIRSFLATQRSAHERNLFARASLRPAVRRVRREVFAAIRDALAGRSSIGDSCCASSALELMRDSAPGRRAWRRHRRFRGTGPRSLPVLARWRSAPSTCTRRKRGALCRPDADPTRQPTAGGRRVLSDRTSADLGTARPRRAVRTARRLVCSARGTAICASWGASACTPNGPGSRSPRSSEAEPVARHAGGWFTTLLPPTMPGGDGRGPVHAVAPPRNCCCSPGERCNREDRA